MTDRDRDALERMREMTRREYKRNAEMVDHIDAIIDHLEAIADYFVTSMTLQGDTIRHIDAELASDKDGGAR